MTDPSSSRLCAPDEAALRAIVADHIDAWNRHDMDGLVSAMRDDVVFINVVGMVWHGRDKVRAAHAVLHQGMFATSRLIPGPLDLRLIAAGLAIGISRTGIEGVGNTPDGRPYPASESVMTLLFYKDGGGWQIVHAHNTNIDVHAAKHDPTKIPAKTNS